MQFRSILLLALFLFSTLELNSQSDLFSKTRIFLQDGKWEKLVEAIHKDLGKSSATDRELMLFQKAYALFEIEKMGASETVFT